MTEKAPLIKTNLDLNRTFQPTILITKIMQDQRDVDHKYYTEQFIRWLNTKLVYDLSSMSQLDLFNSPAYQDLLKEWENK